MALYKFNAITDHKTKQERIYDEVRGAIIQCNFAPGAQIVIRTLASQMNVSEIPVREALKTLISESFVVEKNHNLFVAPITANEFLSMLEVKLELEKIAIRLTARRIDEEMLQLLRDKLQQMDVQYHSGDMEQYKVIHIDFHLSLCTMCGVSYLAKAIEDAFSHHTRGVTYFHLKSWEHGPSIEQHREIVNALERRDAVAAERCVSENRSNATALYKKQIEEQHLS